MKVYLLAILLATGIMPAAANANAFGVEMGEPVSELNVVSDLGDWLYQVSPPTPVSSFETYVVYALPKAGSCIVRGVSKIYERDRYGIDVRKDFSRISGLLDKKYGTGQLLDHLLPGALWDKPEDWVFAIRQNERYYQAEWKVEDKEGLHDIIMVVSATSPSKSWIVLQYRFSNFEDCEKEAAEKEAGGL